MKKTAILLCVFLFLSCNLSIDVQARPKDNDKKLAAVQLSSMKTPVAKFGRKRADELQEHIDNLILNKTQVTDSVTKGEDDITLCLHYEDGTKRLFWFFAEDGNWYMEDFGAVVYKNADFITEYIQVSNSEETAGTFEFSNPYILDLYQKFDTLNMDYYFAREVIVELDYGRSEEEAIEAVRKRIMNRMLLYRYASSHGFDCTGQEVSERMEEYIRQVEKTENYDSVEKLFADKNITYREYMEKSKKEMGIRFAIDKLYQSKTQEFRHGNDTVKGVVYDKLQEFWAAFVEQVVYPEMNLYDSGDIERQLDDAEQYFHRNKDTLVP